MDVCQLWFDAWLTHCISASVRCVRWYCIDTAHGSSDLRICHCKSFMLNMCRYELRINKFVSQFCALAKLLVHRLVDGFEVVFWRECCHRGLHYFGLMGETSMLSFEDHALFRLSESANF